MTGHIKTTDWADGVHTLFTTHRGGARGSFGTNTLSGGGAV